MVDMQPGSFNNKIQGFFCFKSSWLGRMSDRAKQTENAAPRVKVWLEMDGDYVFGHGICSILEAVETAGSIKEAAATVGKSYRHVWSRIKQAEQAIGAPLVESQVGGAQARRTELTPLAKRLVDGFQQFRQRMIAAARSEFERNFPDLV